MTIIIEGQVLNELPDSLDALFRKFPQLEKTGKNFCAQEPATITERENLVYVTQKEYAVVDRSDKWIHFIGTDDATTCHIVVLKNKIDNRVCMAHIDSMDRSERLARMVLDVLGNSSSLDLYLAGGFTDDRSVSENLTFELLQFFKRLPINVHCQLACVGPVNTTQSNGKPKPIVYGAFYDVKQDRLFPAKFGLATRGPLMDLRSARFLGRSASLYRIYHSSDGYMRIDPFDYRYSPCFMDWVEMKDDMILHNFSTSPQVEPPHFAQEIRKVFRFVIQNPFPLHNVFKSKKPLLFKPNASGEWTRIEKTILE